MNSHTDRKQTEMETGTKNEHPKSTLDPRTRRIISVVAIIVIIIFSALVMWFIGRPLIEYIREPEQFRLWVDAHGFLGRLAFIGMIVLQVIVALMPGEVFELGAGYAFGFWEGTLLCMIGFLIGNIIVFCLVRTLGVKIVEAFFPIEKIHSLKFLQNTKRLNLIVFIINFIPGTPKDLIAYAVGLTPIRLRTWILITLVARIPSIITSTIAGGALGDKNYIFAIVVYAITFIISGLGILLYRYITNKHQREDEAREAKAKAALPTGEDESEEAILVSADSQHATDNTK